MDRMKISEIESIANFAYLNPEKANMATAIRQLLAERQDMLRFIVEDHKNATIMLGSGEAGDMCLCKYCTEARELEEK